MFFETLAKKMQEMNYRSIPIEMQGCYIYQFSERPVYTVFVNFPVDTEVDNYMFLCSMQELKKKITMGVEAEFLFVYLTDHPEYIREMCNQPGDTQWIIDRTDMRLIIYENQSNHFYQMEQVIDDVLNPKQMRKGEKIAGVTIGLVVVNVLIYLYMYGVCGESKRDLLMNVGGLFWPAVVRGGEAWRLVTSMFIHAGYEHLINNMMVLYFVGSYVEKYIGHKKYVFLYFATGIVAGVVSMSYNIFCQIQALSVGASGAIYGVVGGLAALVVLKRGLIKDITAPRVLFFIVISIYSGIKTQGVDNSAHIGGLVSGFVIMLIILGITEFWDKRKRRENN